MKTNKNLPKSLHSGFSVPEGYFNKAASKSRLFAKMHQSLDELPLQAPENPFELPDKYFEESKYQILSKINKRTTTVFFLRKEFLRIAALFVGLMGLAYFINLNFEEQTTPQIVQTNNSNLFFDAEYYIENEKDLSDFDWSQLLSDTFFTNELSAVSLTGLEMEDYLAENLNVYDFDEQQP